MKNAPPIAEKHVVIGNTESVDQLFPMSLIHHIQKMASTALASMLPKYPAKHFKKAPRILTEQKVAPSIWPSKGKNWVAGIQYSNSLSPTQVNPHSWASKKTKISRLAYSYGHVSLLREIGYKSRERTSLIGDHKTCYVGAWMIFINQRVVRAAMTLRSPQTKTGLNIRVRLRDDCA